MTYCEGWYRCLDTYILVILATAISCWLSFHELIEQASEPGVVYWPSLAIPYISLTARRLMKPSHIPTGGQRVPALFSSLEATPPPPSETALFSASREAGHNITMCSGHRSMLQVTEPVQRRIVSLDRLYAGFDMVVYYIYRVHALFPQMVEGLTGGFAHPGMMSYLLACFVDKIDGLIIDALEVGPLESGKEVRFDATNARVPCYDSGPKEEYVDGDHDRGGGLPKATDFKPSLGPITSSRGVYGSTASHELGLKVEGGDAKQRVNGSWGRCPYQLNWASSLVVDSPSTLFSRREFDPRGCNSFVLNLLCEHAYSWAATIGLMAPQIGLLLR
ncbi:hypothetical protein VNO77_19436 [Canavalia gladiata]|uniref:Uncharacterized protein n=1 Tax=Canavalia gladiata TaxID=3824 RepID=A0AAN9LMQ1_CANGL